MPLGSLPQTSPGRVGGLVEKLTPGYFALVMASGIISIGLGLTGFRLLSVLLFAVCIVAYVVLLGLNLWRFASFRHAMVEDFKDPKRAFGFFTFVAGTNVLGARAAAEGWYSLTAWLLVVSFSVWLVLGYVIPWSAVLSRAQRPAVALANGTWFIWVVASQSVAVSAATLEVVMEDARAWLAILAVLSWSVGVFLYAASAIIVALRIMLYELDPKDFDPPYWVAMGAVAITVVAGARIVEMESAPMADATQGLVAGLSVVFWAFATWLIPVLVAAGVWRHYVRKVPLVYVPTLWSIIFPLGMYAVAGIYLGRADRLPIVEAIGSSWLWVAVTAWLLVFIAMTRSVSRALVARRPTS
ncbi:MAG TPA: tellurite resistance/C4-dicarboxylate transporter family protein [Intrasporangium sp.]|uniref:tellurite resistance/C4-dicarboxylate transporter family protein n=1 Tax=Intrasporangium sp. TaxID=1925024 RepID=UPI002B47D185|nr:tellurite resistance/C4-dicarboxylate transporter family protein [Intrasporangium sp.]HKX67779.1 tellurite resistance/C4-dicarboxylate transporter family protein [Intrasporangium sp.]